MYKVLSLLRSLLHRVLPYSDANDSFLNYIAFFIHHKRLPKDRYYFNDYLFKIKNTNEILNPIRQFVSDKYLVKDYVRAKVGEQYNVPTIAVFNSYQDLKDFDFPANCCIKPTQASQAVILRKNNEPINISEAEKWFELNYYKKTRERNYKYLKPKVIVEPLIFNSTDLMDYRIYCFKGKAKLICLDVGKFTGYQRVFYTIDWVKQDFSLKYPLYEGELEKPKNLDEMIIVAEKLSSELDFVRIDLYSDGESCLVGEITNCHAAASQNFVPLSAEKKASEIIFGERV
ncbi:ATP-grasp fold amidoligase family protein [Acinetobacter towneri]|uniref:ATP-grasp fold amidoligase family protein n=1 Tax=Acinetobacter towneri TaxID=202956 RepID=UPI003A8BAAA3